MRMKLYIAGEVLLTIYLYFVSYFYTQTVPLTWTSPLRLLVIGFAVHKICGWISGKHISILNASRKKIGSSGWCCSGSPLQFYFCIMYLIIREG